MSYPLSETEFLVGTNSLHKKKKKKKKKKYTPYALLACCVARAQYLGVFFDLGEIK